MISNYLSSIEDVGIYPIISLILFFAVFVGVVIWVFTRDKEYISELENIPLDKNNSINNSEIKNENN